MGAVAITRTDLSAAELRASAAQMKDARPARRALAILSAHAVDPGVCSAKRPPRPPSYIYQVVE